MLPEEVVARIRSGLVIPAHPLALTAQRRLDERRQRALSRYYLTAGAGGLAVGVHTTQFQIHRPEVGLLKPVLQLAAEVARQDQVGKPPVVMIAGICGQTQQAVAEAEMAVDCGYHAGLVSLAAFPEATEQQLMEHCRALSHVIPIFGFYLQTAVGGRLLPFAFWRRFVEIENVVAIKIAPFNRYQTLDVVRAVVESGRSEQIALYTGNDDNIVLDLLTPFCFSLGDRALTVRIVGGLLGHWAVWTQKAVQLLQQIHHAAEGPILRQLLQQAVEITDANAALFDAANHFAGCIAGLHEVLRRQGLMAGRWCLDPDEDLSDGQMAQIDRIEAAYPHLQDDTFVAQHLEKWLA